MSKSRFENLEIYQLAERLADYIWDCVLTWDKFSKETVGEQIVNSSDSIGANIAEGSGKGSEMDFKRYCKIARGSLFETKHWLRRAYKRNLLKKEEIDNIKITLEELLPKLSAYINYLDDRINNKNYDD
ncbi:MAG: four helix bundle protein [Bacteroidetes bacterium]|nr:four helix bundle protein [Bacteroidota bacterium]